MTIAHIFNLIFRTTGKGLLSVFKFKISWFILFFMIILLQAGINSFQQKSFAPFFTEVSQEFILATENLNEQSLSVIDKGGIWDIDLKLHPRVWDFVKNMWYYFKSMIIIYFWLKILMYFFIGFMMDTSKSPAGWGLAIFTFIGIQMVASVTIGVKLGGSGDPFVVFNAFKNFFFSLPYIVKPISGVAEGFVRDTPKNITQLNNTI